MGTKSHTIYRTHLLNKLVPTVSCYPSIQQHKTLATKPKKSLKNSLLNFKDFSSWRKQKSGLFFFYIHSINIFWPAPISNQYEYDPFSCLRQETDQTRAHSDQSNYYLHSHSDHRGIDAVLVHRKQEKTLDRTICSTCLWTAGGKSIWALWAIHTFVTDGKEMSSQQDHLNRSQEKWCSITLLWHSCWVFLKATCPCLLTRLTITTRVHPPSQHHLGCRLEICEFGHLDCSAEWKRALLQGHLFVWQGVTQSPLTVT